MNRPIKFRGRRSDGTFVYGLYVNIHGDDFIRDENNRGWLVTNVAQLVGIDINGREVYEGDVLTDERGRKFVAKLMPVGENSGKYVTVAKFALNTLKLKEETP